MSFWFLDFSLSFIQLIRLCFAFKAGIHDYFYIFRDDQAEENSDSTPFFRYSLLEAYIIHSKEDRFLWIAIFS